MSEKVLQMAAALANETERLRALNRELVEALESVVMGNDIALERGLTIEHWRNSHASKQARKALAKAKEQL